MNNWKNYKAVYFEDSPMRTVEVKARSWDEAYEKVENKYCPCHIEDVYEVKK